MMVIILKAFQISYYSVKVVESKLFSHSSQPNTLIWRGNRACHEAPELNMPAIALFCFPHFKNT